jgi:hypothetical protein
MDMIYHWLTDRVRIKQLNVYWRTGKDNLGIIILNIIQHNTTKIYAHSS